MLQILSLLINEEDAKWDLTFSIQRGVWHAPVSTQITDSAERNAIMSAPFTGKINTATRQVVNFPHYQKNISSSICIFKTFFNASVPLLDGIENIVAFLIHSYLLFTFLKLWLTTENWTCSFVFDNLILSDLTNTATFLCLIIETAVATSYFDSMTKWCLLNIEKKAREISFFYNFNYLI